MFKEIILQKILGLISINPIPWIAKRVYPSKKFEEHIYIRPRDYMPISFSLRVSNAVPRGTFAFEIFNCSPYLDSIIDSFNFNLILEGEWIISKANCKEDVEIKRGESKEITCWIDLTDAQIRKIQEIKESQKYGRQGKATIDVEACLKTKFYKIKKNVRLHSIDYEIS